MQIQNALITGSFSYNGADLSNITSSNAYSASLSSRTTDLESTSSVLVGASSSFSSILTSVSSSQQQISASLLALTASYNALSSSYTALSASYNTASSSFSTRITSDSSSMSSRTTQVEKTYASTGSNTFTGLQNFSNTCTPNSFTAGASIYTAGGLQVTQDSYFSSSVFIKGNVTVFGTQSVSYISSSQLDIGTNIITVNTSTPSVRYGGLSVFDSGSTGLTGSIFWDSELNRWIYVNASGSGGGATYGGGMFISGPRNSVGLGCEQGTTACMLLVGQGGDHLTSSMIYHSSTVTCIPNAIVGGSTACFTGNTIVSTTGNTTLTINGTSGVPALSFTNTGGTNNIYGGVGSVANITIAPGDVNAVKIFAVGCVSCFAGTICVPNIISTGASGGRYATFSAPSNGGYITFDAGGTAFGDLGSYCAQYGTGDATTLLLGSRTGYALALGTNSTERLRITCAGSVGIGMTTPVGFASDDLVLQISNPTGGGSAMRSMMRFTNVNSGTTWGNGTFLGLDSTLDFYIGQLENAPIIFQTNSSERMRISCGGNVGIGTCSPIDLLHIEKFQAGGMGMVIRNACGATSNTSMCSLISLQLVGAGQTGQLGVNLIAGKEGDYSSAGTRNAFFAIQTACGDNLYERLRITSGGNVIVGATTSDLIGSFKFISVGNSGFQYAASTGTYLRIEPGAADTEVALKADARSGGYPPMTFYTSATERMRITSGGNVVFNGGDANGWYAGFSNSSTNFAYMGATTQFANSGGSSTDFGIRAANALVFYTSGGNERMRITSTGATSITSTGQPLYLLRNSSSQGQILFSTNHDSAGYVHTMYITAAGEPNAAATGYSLGKNSGTNRSINAGGTINASGADYAEYMTKAIENNIAKGDIVGVDENGLLTNIFGNSISFVVKSTDPSYIGGDTWFNEIRPSENATQKEKNEFEARYQIARAKVDRIAFSGQVPCNVTGSNVGDYIIPIQLENGKISGQAVTNPTFEQYQISVGKVWKIMEDGRAWIAVKIG